jgi:2-C-methyl-D-erythritol 2,4-cyclodiphosphate synthase
MDKRPIRLGFGYDVHRLVPGRPLRLGGVQIPYPYGLQGHSDADVLLHAICDALLGAIGEGDIGRHFPDTDPQYKNIPSTLLLQRTMEKVKEKNFHLLNVDATLVAQKPRLAEHIPQMVIKISEILRVERECVNVKSTTEEGLGFTGRGEGIAAYAVVLLEKD